MKKIVNVKNKKGSKGSLTTRDKTILKKAIADGLVGKGFFAVPKSKNAYKLTKKGSRFEVVKHEVYRNDYGKKGVRVYTSTFEIA